MVAGDEKALDDDEVDEFLSLKHVRTLRAGKVLNSLNTRSNNSSWKTVVKHHHPQLTRIGAKHKLIIHS